MSVEGKDQTVREPGLDGLITTATAADKLSLENPLTGTLIRQGRSQGNEMTLDHRNLHRRRANNARE